MAQSGALIRTKQDVDRGLDVLTAENNLYFFCGKLSYYVSNRGELETPMDRLSADAVPEVVVFEGWLNVWGEKRFFRHFLM